MPEKRKFPRNLALEVAREIHALILPFCVRCKIVGSLRRNKSHVGDIEVLYIPKEQSEVKDLFKTEVAMLNLANQRIDQLVADGVITKRKSSAGHYAWGEQNRLAVHVASEIPVDFFATTEAKWWNSLVIRTGGKSTNLMLTMGANKQGMTLHAYGEGFTVLKTGEKIQTHSEEDVFRIAGVRYNEPRYRP